MNRTSAVTNQPGQSSSVRNHLGAGWLFGEQKQRVEVLLDLWFNKFHILCSPGAREGWSPFPSMNGSREKQLDG